MRPKRQHTRKIGYDGVTNATLRSNNQLLQQQPHAHTVTGCCCWGAGLLLGGRIVGWCSVQKEEKKRVRSTRAEKPGLHPNFACVRGDKGCRNPIPAGMLRKPGDLPQVCPRQKTFKRLATHDALHGSRPNLRQREPDGRIAPTPPDVWDKGASTKRCARRKKKIVIIHIHISV